MLVESGARFLRASAKNLGIQAAKEREWDLEQYPVLSWKWRPREFPKGANEQSGKNDSVLSVYAVFPHSRSGIVGAVLIGLGRAMGETIAVALVIGSATQLSGRLFSPGDTMAAVIANQFGEATGTYRAALVGLGVVLFVITIIIGVIARAFVARMDARSSGA